MSAGNSRVYGLDILRATAILLVLLTHSIYFFTNSWDNEYIIKYLPDGVSIFFVLSGFLIGNILIKTLTKPGLSMHDLKNFWIRRWFRTLPAYYVALSLIISGSWLFYHDKKPVWEYIKYYLFLQAFNDGNAKVYMESWSLCVEEFFYLVVPMLLFLSFVFTKFPAKKIFAFWILLVIVLVTSFNIYKINANNYTTVVEWDIYIRKTVFTRLGNIMYGFLGAYLMTYYFNLWKYKTAFFVLGIGLFAFLSVRPAFGFGPSFNYEQLSFESIATLLLVPKLSSLQTGKGLVFKWLTFVSTISYSIYLVNFTPFYRTFIASNGLLNTHSLKFAFARLMLFILWSFGIGYLLYRFVEKPMMKKREFLSHKEYGKTIFVTVKS